MPPSPYAQHTNTTLSAAACDQTSVRCSGAVPPWRSLTGSFPRLSCNTVNIKPRLHTMTVLDEITVCTTAARAGVPLPKSCINISVISHRSAASICNPRSTIILHRFVHACCHNPWTGARCNFLIDLRWFSILSDLRAQDMQARFLHWIRLRQQWWKRWESKPAMQKFGKDTITTPAGILKTSLAEFSHNRKMKNLN